jgi:Zn-dependent M28 family amino/carboxypeptidase
VVAYIKGSVKPDSFLVFSAHYDHLGKMGPALFPGANDNASGTSMILDLARYYNLPENKPRYSIAFMAFSGEEAGLLGSTHYVSEPLFPLKSIRFLINLDMVGTGSKGIKVVNGASFEKEFNILSDINKAKGYLADVGKRGPSAHSDHHPFFEKGVPAVFIYTTGDEFKEYHNIYDVPEKLPFTKYEALFHLLTDFVNTF